MNATLLAYTNDAVDHNIRTCLNCMKFRLVEHGKLLRCDVKPMTKELVSRFNDERYSMALRRASGCKEYVTEDRP
jgi:hypothetical protein